MKEMKWNEKDYRAKITRGWTAKAVALLVEASCICSIRYLGMYTRVLALLESTALLKQFKGLPS